MARKWDLLIAHYYFKSMLAASIRLSSEYLWEKKKEILFWKEDVQTCIQSCHAFFSFVPARTTFHFLVMTFKQNCCFFCVDE